MRREGVDFQVPLARREVKSLIQAKGLNLWQREWDACSKGRQFHCAHQSVKDEVVSMGCRREEVVWSRLQFGITGLNATLWMIRRHETGLCDECLVEETVEHGLIFCELYEVDRERLCERVVDWGEGSGV